MPGSLWIDAGAHIGAFSCLALSAGASVISVEAAPENARVLRRNVARVADAAREQSVVLELALVGSLGSDVESAGAAGDTGQGDGAGEANEVDESGVKEGETAETDFWLHPTTAFRHSSEPPPTKTLQWEKASQGWRSGRRLFWAGCFHDHTWTTVS